MPRETPDTQEAPIYVTNERLYHELKGMDEKVDRLVTPLRVAVGVLVPMNGLVAWKVFGSPAPAEVGAAFVRLIFG